MSKLKKITKFKQIKKMKVGDEVILVRPPITLGVTEVYGEKKVLTGEADVWDQTDLDADLAAGWAYYRVS